MDNLAILSLVYKFLPYFLREEHPEGMSPETQHRNLSDKDRALLNLKQKDGAVVVILGTRDTGKSELAYRLAEFLGKPTYAVSPEQKPHPGFIRRIKLEDLGEVVPSNSTIILDDVPVYMSSRSYHDSLVQTIEKIIPVVRHEKKFHLIFVTQSASQADKYILDADAAFLKPGSIFFEDLERAGIKKIYQQINPYFEGKSDWWIKTHAYMITREYQGVIEVKKVDNKTANVPIDVNFEEVS